RPWHALIRTHHITSLKKVAKLRHAASEHGVFAMLRSGGKGPGIMYVTGINSGRVAGWVGSVKKLRYKDYQLAVRPAPALQDRTASINIGLEEIESVKDYSRWMEERGLLQWWRQGMGY
ncbi:uncharacterized protein K489DRAFT_309328, partial [Dissoconium aciculare CBS 342.82]|uniref:Uncharacterized protein n=1 Tax=Dissoconium aciculare CBS 342.82 TaxID=1314786 RepID=A0A6J3M4W7_9PEZI